MREFAKIEIGNGEIIKNMKINSIQSPRTSYYKESAKARRWKKQQRIHAQLKSKQKITLGLINCFICEHENTSDSYACRW